MPQTLISKINGVDIVTVEQDGEIFVPIKPICDALGIDVDAQRNKLNADEFFNSTTAIITAVAADDKERGLCPDSIGAQIVQYRLAILRLRRETLRSIFRQYYYLLN